MWWWLKWLSMKLLMNLVMVVVSLYEVIRWLNCVGEILKMCISWELSGIMIMKLRMCVNCMVVRMRSVRCLLMVGVVGWFFIKIGSVCDCLVGVSCG